MIQIQLWWPGVIKIRENWFVGPRIDANPANANFQYLWTYGMKAGSIIEGNVFGVGMLPGDGDQDMSKDPIEIRGCQNVVFPNNVVRSKGTANQRSVYVDNIDTNNLWNYFTVVGNITRGGIKYRNWATKTYRDSLNLPDSVFLP